MNFYNGETSKFAMPQSNLEVALRYVNAGVYVHPCRINKTPWTKWREESTCDRETVLRWWRQWPDALVGIDCGKSDLFVIDCDRKKGGPDGVLAFDAFIEEHGWPDGTPVTSTPGNGYHYYFRQPPHLSLGNRTGSLPAGVDVRGNGGYVIAPGSMMPDGRGWKAADETPDLASAYGNGSIHVVPEWLNDCIFSAAPSDGVTDMASPATEPGAEASRLTSENRADRFRAYALAALKHNAAALEACHKGGRNILLNNVSLRAGRMAASGSLTKEEAFAAFKQACMFNGYIADKGLKAFSDTFESGFRFGLTRPLPDPVNRDASFDEGAQAFADALDENESTGADGSQSKAAPMWPDPTPIESRLPTVKKLTPDMLPESIRGYVFDVADRQQSPVDFVAVSALCGLATLAGNTVRIKPKRYDDWLITPNIWAAIIGRPSAMKSPALKAAIAVIYGMQDDLRKKWEHEVKERRIDAALDKLDAKDADKRASAAIKRGDRDEARKILSDQGEETAEEPPCPRLVVNDATVEKLGELLNENPRGLMLVRDELPGWLARMQREEFQSERAFYLEAFDGDGQFTYDRIGRGTIHIENCTLSLVGGVQPSRIAPLVRGAMIGVSDDGLVQRLQLAVWPDDLTDWVWTDRRPNASAKAQYEAAFRELHAFTSELLFPATFHFSDEAQEMFREWMEEIQKEARSGNIAPTLESHILKMPKAVAALALIFHLVDGGRDEAVGAVAAARALEWADYLRSHAARLYAAGSVAAENGARLIIERRAHLPEKFTAREVERKNWAGLSDRDTVDDAIAILLETHHLFLATKPSGRSGGRPSDTYFWNPRLEAEA